jgi:hypothetical protein
VKLHPRPERVCILGFAGEPSEPGNHASSWELVRLLNRCWSEGGVFTVETVASPAELPGGTTDWQRFVHAASDAALPDGDARDGMLRIATTFFGAAVERLAQADFVIVQGADDPCSQSEDARTLGLVMPWVARHVFMRPIAWVNQSARETSRGRDQAESRAVQLADVQWGRDSGALRWLLDAGCRQPGLVPDTVFLVEPLEHASLAQQLHGRSYFCVEGSALSADTNICLEAVRLITAATGLLPVFVGNAAVTGDALRVAAAARGIESAAIPADMIYPAVADVMGRAACLVGSPGRLAMMAAIGGTPTVVVTRHAGARGLRELLAAEWPSGDWGHGHELAAATEELVRQPAEARARVRDRVAGVRAAIVAATAAWQQEGGRKCVRPAVDLSAAVRSSPQPPVLPQVLPLTVYLRRGVTPTATFQCLRQLVDHRLDDMLEQLDVRWLVSICDSYADHGDPVDARNGLLIATFLNWERLAATHALWADPQRHTMHVDAPAAQNVPLWGGLYTVHLRRGDTVNNMLIRYARALAATPSLLAIWRTLVARIRKADSVLASLDRPHGHLFDEDLRWMADEQLTDIPRWRRPPPSPTC